MPELPPRPGPSDQVLYLHRRPKSEFVNFPPFFQTRMVDGRARFMTKCDMLIGPCACGYTHTEDERWVRELLDMYNCKIEPLILWGIELGDRGRVVEIPGYWKQGRYWTRPHCDVLVGRCSCGRTHTPNQNWVKRLLIKHGAIILNMPPVEEPTPPEQVSQGEINQAITQQINRARCSATASQLLSPSRRWRDAPQYASEENVEGEDAEFNEYLAAIVEGRMDLPPVLMDRVDTAAGVPSCDCSDCERIRFETLRSVATSWIRDCRREAIDHTSRQWSIHHCNAIGELPYFCNCSSCTSQRLASLDPQINVLQF